jgi:hypothetical protein
MSVNQLAYLYGEYALRIAGAYNVPGAVERGTR